MAVGKRSDFPPANYFFRFIIYFPLDFFNSSTKISLKTSTSQKKLASPEQKTRLIYLSKRSTREERRSIISILIKVLANLDSLQDKYIFWGYVFCFDQCSQPLIIIVSGTKRKLKKEKRESKLNLNYSTNFNSKFNV